MKTAQTAARITEPLSGISGWKGRKNHDGNFPYGAGCGVAAAGKMETKNRAGGIVMCIPGGGRQYARRIRILPCGGASRESTSLGEFVHHWTRNHATKHAGDQRGGLIASPTVTCIKATPLRWGLRASADLLPQARSTKNGKYIQYSRIFRTFACAKISRRISLPHYAVLP